MKYNLDRKLTKSELKCLASIHKEKLNYSDENNCRIIDTLFMYDLINCSMDMEGILNYKTAKLTEKGISYLEETLSEKKRNTLSEARSWIAIFISVCALLVSLLR